MNAPLSKSTAKRLVHLAMYHPVPATWGDCVETGRHLNCEVARCRYNLRYSIRKSGKLKRHNAAESCALAVACRGENELHQIGEAMGCTHERVRQILEGALTKLQRSISLRELAADLGVVP